MQSFMARKETNHLDFMEKSNKLEVKRLIFNELFKHNYLLKKHRKGKPGSDIHLSPFQITSMYPINLKCSSIVNPKNKPESHENHDSERNIVKMLDSSKTNDPINSHEPGSPSKCNSSVSSFFKFSPRSKVPSTGPSSHIRHKNLD